MPNLVVLITAAFAAGIWCANYFRWLLPFLYVSSFVTMFILVRQIYRQKQTIWLFATLFFVIGMLRFIHDDALSPADISHYTGEKVTVYGTIVETPQVAALEEDINKVRYIIETKKVQREKQSVVATGRLFVSSRQSNKETIFQQGNMVQVNGEIIMLHGYNNPGQYDSVAAAQLQGIRGRMSVYGKEISIVDNSYSWKQVATTWRERIIENIKKVMPESHKAILAGILFGGYGGIPREIVADFSTTGIVHILSVSGSHIALVAGIVTVLGKNAFKGFMLADKIVPLFAAFFITLYAVFCGLTPPVLRSLIMGLIGLGAVCLEREKDAAVALCLSVFGMLIYQPALIYDLSFQLSFASTAGLVFLHAKTVSNLRFLPLWLASPLAITISAQIGVLPFIAWYFNSFSLSSFIANLIIVPIIEGIVILGLFGAFSGLLIGFVGNVSMVICSLLIGLVLQLTKWLAAMPAAKLYVPPIGFFGSILYYGLLCWMYGYKPKNVLSLRETIKKWPQKSAVVVLFLVLCIISYTVYPRPVSVHFIDVGQGDAALIVTPHGRAILVDTGGTMGEAVDFDIGYRVVLPYLRHYGIQELDYLFLTHGHQDHAGGAAGIAREISVKNIMLSQEKYTQAVANLLHVIPRNSVIIATYEGQRIELDGVVIEVLHADTGVNGQSGNEVSSVIRASYGKYSFLFTGDLPAHGEEQMLQSNKDISSTVLKVGHHGARTSSTAEFLQAVAPKYAVISVGNNNSFGHPHGDTIRRLEEQHSKIYRTDKQGAIVFKTNGTKMKVDTFLSSD